ncbi:hypothetical protein CWATWH0003_1757 [Crocosphaera watsonii WH 0003]|uniref:Uncharacterized protein n=2 Tax=Crocosphaera watsonii TaxID=263511 RepID=G5J2M3_CROWT|nr:hypothetical protein CWATWH0003_1757 [Crocosphaera watsonii WH 0003]CCQ59505.1 hypothetical protein CWATWH0005_2119 [Crocosphaera watsonii WH 0005]
MSLGTCENKIITIPTGIRYESPALQPGERQVPNLAPPGRG